MAARCRESPTPRKNAQPRGKLVALLDRMEQSLTETKWLAADTYSIADIGAVPFVERIEEEIAPDEVSAANHPRVTAWWQAIQACPAFARVRIGPFVSRDSRRLTMTGAAALPDFWCR